MKQISHYLVEEPPIGKSEMGFIYKATDAEGNVVAIKEIIPEFAEDIEMRFRINQEMRFLERLDHPSVVKTYESFMLADQYYIVMEFVNGRSIEHYVAENGVMSEQEAIELMIQILEVMDYVHQQGIVHRDIKPSNIMVQPDGQIKVLDFGIAKDMNSNGHTQVGAVIGSDGYMSPEQADGMAIDHRSDIYSLGCVLFYMVTGHHAYPPQSSEAQMLMSLEKPFPRIKQYNSSISKKFQDVLDTATDKNMLRRYNAFPAFKQALQQIETRNPASVRRYEDSQRNEMPMAQQYDAQSSNDPTCPSSNEYTQKMSHSRSIFGKIFNGVGSVVESIVNGVVGSIFRGTDYGQTPRKSKNQSTYISSTQTINRSNVNEEIMDNVYSSVFAPAEVKLKSRMMVQVYLHLSEETEQVKVLATEADKNAERRDYIPLQTKLKKGDKVDVVLNINGDRILYDNSKSIIWQGSFCKCVFEYLVPSELNVNELSCSVNLYVNGAIVGEMLFYTKIVDSPTQLNANVVAKPVKKLFISYSHNDLKSAEQIAKLYEGLDIEVFFDKHRLKAGYLFSEEIFNFIRTADTFVLCWSENAAQSEYVEKERKAALELAYPNCRPRENAQISIKPYNIQPYATPPNDMVEHYHFEEL